MSKAKSDSQKSETNAITLLRKDHETVKQLFERFENTEDDSEKDEIIAEALDELKIHATLEEEIFYPAVREEVGEDDEHLMNEADEEHHVARILIAELDEASEDVDRRNAKFKVLAEGVQHHIKEEEGEMLPRARELEIDFEDLGKQMLDRKQELMDDGVPEDAEHEMISNAAMGAAAGSEGRSSRPKTREAETMERTTVASGSGSRSRKSRESKEKESKNK